MYTNVFQRLLWHLTSSRNHQSRNFMLLDEDTDGDYSSHGLNVMYRLRVLVGLSLEVLG
jgi:hypothetical protein